MKVDTGGVRRTSTTTASAASVSAGARSGKSFNKNLVIEVRWVDSRNEGTTTRVTKKTHATAELSQLGTPEGLNVKKSTTENRKVQKS